MASLSVPRLHIKHGLISVGRAGALVAGTDVKSMDDRLTGQKTARNVTVMTGTLNEAAAQAGEGSRQAGDSSRQAARGSIGEQHLLCEKSCSGISRALVRDQGEGGRPVVELLLPVGDEGGRDYHHEGSRSPALSHHVCHQSNDLQAWTAQILTRSPASGARSTQ